MTNNPFMIQKDIEAAQRELDAKKLQLGHIQSNCRHEWNEIVPAHVHHEGYTIPGDPPGTMGVDWRGDFYVPSRTEHRWQRTCKHCNLTQSTDRTKKQSVTVKIPGISGTSYADATVPDFGDK